MSSTPNTVATAALEYLGQRLWGFRPRLMTVIVQRLGPVRALAWFARNMPRYQQSLRVYGSLRAHLLCVTVSLVNGCRYCTFGHAYAFELIYLREHRTLFPLDENAIVALHKLDPPDIRAQLVDAVRLAGLDVEVVWIDRMLERVTGVWRVTSRDDARLDHLIRMFEVLNVCGIAEDVAPDQAHDPTNRNRALKDHYAALRAADSA